MRIHTLSGESPRSLSRGRPLFFKKFQNVMRAASKSGVGYAVLAEANEGNEECFRLFLPSYHLACTSLSLKQCYSSQYSFEL